MEEYNSLYNKEKTFVENLHDCLKLHHYVKGKHYIEIDCGEYICICPFCYGILGRFRGFFKHCVCCNEDFFKKYFNEEFYKYGNLKAFFFKKDFKFRYSDRYGYKVDDKYWEFTCWLYVRTRHGEIERIWYDDNYINNFFYFFHDSSNRTNSSEIMKNVSYIIENYYHDICSVFKNSKRYKELWSTKKI